MGRSKGEQNGGGYSRVLQATLLAITLEPPSRGHGPGVHNRV